MARPLEGIRVLEWAAFHNGPAAGYMLGDLGAEVIKIEEPIKGDPGRGAMSMYGQAMAVQGRVDRPALFELSNRNKKSVTLDLRKEEGKEAMHRLVKQSDVFITNYYRDNVQEKLGLDYETLKQINPRLVYALNTGYGTKGKLANARAFDFTAQALTGFMFSAGERSSNVPTLNVATPFDQIGGTLSAFAIVTALLAREHTGHGQKVEVSLLGSAVHLQAIIYSFALLRGKAFSRHSRTRCSQPLSNYYACADGKWLYISEPQADRFWREFCSVVGLEGLSDDKRFVTFSERAEHNVELIEILDKTFAGRSRDEWVKLFEERRAEFSYAPVLDYAEAIESSQINDNDYIVDFDHPVLGKVKFVNLPMKFSDCEVGPVSAAPALGQDTESVLLGLGGYSWDQIGSFRDKGVI